MVAFPGTFPMLKPVCYSEHDARSMAAIAAKPKILYVFISGIFSVIGLNIVSVFSAC